MSDVLAEQGIVCVGFADWDNETWSNQHHLMSRLAAEGVQILFVESLGLRRPQLGSGRDLSRIARRLRKGLAPPRRSHGLTVLSPMVLPSHSRPAVRALNAWLLRRQVTRAAERIGLRHPVLWAYVPQAEALLAPLRPSLVVYHCVDDIAAQDGIDGEAFAAAERRFAAGADLVLASAPALADRMGGLSDNVLYAPNVADTDHFAHALQDGPVDPALARLPEPRLVFVGAISETKLDLELLGGLARARPDWTIALVGPVGLGDPGTDVSALSALPNVHLLGLRSHADLPQVLRGAAVGLIPYRSNRLTASIFPMKVYEYLAAGLPVISTPLPALIAAPPEGVVIVDGVEETVAAVQQELSADQVSHRRARSARALSHSWEARLDEIGRAVERLTPSEP